MMPKAQWLVFLVLLFVNGGAVQADLPFDFYVAADTRQYAGPGTYDSCAYFRGVTEAMQSLGPAAFVISPGDIDPPSGVQWTLTDTLGADVMWYPTVGNHELPGGGSESSYGANLAWLAAYNYDANGPLVPPNIVRLGPSTCPTTTYAFDYANAHFVILNEYCDQDGNHATDGDISDTLYTWLRDDLQANTLPFVFVVGHEPAYPQPDEESGRVRHLGDSLDRHPAHRDRFWDLLWQEGVTAYFCGHTHNYSATRIDGVLQIDAGHARGQGDVGARSTFLKVSVDAGQVTFTTYRVSPTDPCAYQMTDQWSVEPLAVKVRWAQPWYDESWAAPLLILSLAVVAFRAWRWQR